VGVHLDADNSEGIHLDVDDYEGVHLDVDDSEGVHLDTLLGYIFDTTDLQHLSGKLASNGTHSTAQGEVTVAVVRGKQYPVSSIQYPVSSILYP